MKATMWVMYFIHENIYDDGDNYDDDDVKDNAYEIS